MGDEELRQLEQHAAVLKVLPNERKYFSKMINVRFYTVEFIHLIIIIDN